MMKLMIYIKSYHWKLLKKVKTKEDYNNLLNYMVLSLYTLHKPRRNIDYTLMKISNDISNDEFNYLDLKRQIFIFNLYRIGYRVKWPVNI